jgi:hypothetical protein
MDTITLQDILSDHYLNDHLEYTDQYEMLNVLLIIGIISIWILGILILKKLK